MYFVYVSILVIVSLIKDLSSNTLLLIALAGIAGLLLELLSELHSHRRMMQKLVDSMDKK